MAEATLASSGELADRLRRGWIGERWDAVVLDDIQLLSPPRHWPALIRLDYRLGGQPARHEETWRAEEFPADCGLEAASGCWLSMLSLRLMDRLEPPPEDLEPER